MTGTRIGVAFLKVLFSAGVIFTVATTKDASKYSADCTLSALDYRLPSDIIPRYYNIKLEQKKSGFEGASSTVIEVTRRTANIIFHGYKLQIKIKTLSLLKHEQDDNDQDIIDKLKDFHYCDKSQIYVLTLQEKLSPGYYTLSMRFSGVLHSNQGFIVTNIVVENSKYVTLFEPTGARRVFPCWDEPRFKAIFNISVERPFLFRVYSNMQNKNETLLPQNKELTKFESTPVMSTYLVTIASIAVIFESEPESELSAWPTWPVMDEMSAARKAAKVADNFLIDYTNNLWNNLTIRIIMYPNLPVTTVGAWGLAIFRNARENSPYDFGNTTFRERYVYYNPDYHFPGRNLEVWKLVARQMARQCIESFVSPMEWSHQWFSHAFAMFLSYKIVAKKYSEDDMMQLFVVQVLQPALHNDIALKVPAVIDDYDPIYSSLVYKKASALINMLQYIVKEEVLQRAFARYLNTYAYGSATPSDFFRILQEEMHQPAEHYCNITAVMNVWLSQRSYPTLLVQQSYDGKRVTVVSGTMHSYKEQTKWPVPVTFTTEEYPIYMRNVSTFWLNNNSSRTPNIALDIQTSDRKQWIIFNVLQLGYYRVNYGYENWIKIVKYLNNGDHKQIHVLNRAQIIDDAYHSTMNHEIKHVIFYELIGYLRKETNFIAWHSMMNVLQYMSSIFNYPESATLKKYILHIMEDVLMTIGYYENPTDNEMLKATRLLLLNWACKHGHAQCRARAYHKLYLHINNPKKNTISPGWEDWTYCAGLMDANMVTLLKTLNHILQGKNERLLQHMDCIDNDCLFKDLVALSIGKCHGDWNKVATERIRKIYRGVVKKHARKDQVLDYILNKFNVLDLGYKTRIEAIVDIIMSVYSNCQLNKILNYVYSDSKWDENSRNEVKRLISFRKNQINKQKDTFVRPFHDGTVVNEC